MILNENNIQSPFQYKISENSFELKIVSGGFLLNTNNVQVKVFEGQRLFCADIGYAIDGAVEEMEFLIDSIKVYPVVLDELEDLQTVDVKDNEIYLIKNEIDFKSIVFFPPIDLNKRFDFTITTYSSTFSSFMFDEIAKKLNSLDINYPVKNYYRNTDYKVNDIIKNNGYLYRVFKDFTSDDTDYYLKNNCNLITPFKKLELDTDYKANELIEYNNNFLIVQKDFRYESKNGVLINLNSLLKPLQDIIIWFDSISKIYKNQIIIKDNFSYIVLEDIENPIWENIQKKIDYLNKAENTFYDDTNSCFGNNTNNVQKAIEKLKSGKQDSLTAGNNINLNGNNISVIGGTSKEYILENNYFINDLIVKDEKIYRVNEDFISSEWTTDRIKLTLISSVGSGGVYDAIDVSYDNSKINLKYLIGYDYPKFKTPIPNSMSVMFSSFTGNIIKSENENYLLSMNLNNIYFSRNVSGALTLTEINGKTNFYEMYSILSQFFDLTSQEQIIAESGEINIEGVETAPSFLISFYSDPPSNKMFIQFYIYANSEIEDGNYNVTLNIKNRLLRQEDRNIFAFSDPFMGTQNIMDNYIFNLSQNNNSVKLTGSYTLKQGAGLTIGFYSSIIENYFNVSSSGEWTNTTGITSSSKKSLKFSLYKNNNVGNVRPLYLLFLMHQDETDLQVGEKITFNLTPNKNSTLNSIYQNVTNVQELGEALNEKNTILQSNITSLQQKDTELLNKINSLKAVNIKMDTISGLSASNVQQGLQALNNKINSSSSIFNLIPNGTEYKHPTERFNGKPVYYRCWYKSDGTYPDETRLGYLYNLDKIVMGCGFWNNLYEVGLDDAVKIQISIITFEVLARAGVKQAILKYTKTTDSKIL
ncbi:phage tail protein [Brachyspira intermedia]|uniref:phage tail protein n=1 Tax=Brachyspira intermedia TaxID=84377 RepID=UPI003F7BF011